MDRKSMATGIENKTFNSSSGKDVKDTSMLKGEAKDSLGGSNSTVQNQRSGSVSGKLGGRPTVK